MNILVLGCEGFIGRNLTAMLVQKGHAVTGCDLLDEPIAKNYTYTKLSRLAPDWETVFQNRSFDFCINASGSGNVPYSVSNPQEDFEANTLDVVRILDAIRKYNGTCKYIHISSAAVYGNPVQLPVKETDALAPVSPYGFHKLMSEMVCQEFYSLYQVPVAILRPFSVYGAGLRKQLFWDICKKINAPDEDEVTLFGTGNESRDFIYITDLAELVYLIISKSDFACSVYNAALGTEITIKEIAGKIQEKCNGKKISFNGEVRTGDPLNWRADVEKIKVLGFEPKVTMDNGIEQYLDWFLQENSNG